MKNKIILGLAGVVIAFAGWLTHFVTPNLGAVSQLPAVESWLMTTATSGAMTLTATEQRIIATSTARQWLTLSAGNGCTQGFWASFANDVTATANNSMFIASSTRLEVKVTEHPYIGSIRGLSNGGSCVINVTGQ